MNQYNLKLENRKKYYRDMAEKSREAADERANWAIETVSNTLPAGQPVIVGHSSEKKHRALLGRVYRSMEQATVLMEKADYYEQKAKNVGRYSGISSDDPDAVEKLKIELADACTSSARSRIRKRIAELEKRKTFKNHELVSETFTFKQDWEINRLMFIFNDKPDNQVITLLKKNGFKWAPSKQAWIRQITGNAQYAARLIMRELKA